MTQPWRVAFFLFFAAGLNYADRTALSSVIPPLRDDLGVTDVQIGVMGMLFLWSYAIASPFAGNMADRFSRSKIVVWSLVGWSVITVFTGLAQGVLSLFVLRALLGLAESFYLPAAGALLGDHHAPATRGRAMGLHVLGLNLGILFGGAFAGLLAEHFGWRPGFWVLGGLGLVLALISPRFLSDGPVRVEAAGRNSGVKEAWNYLVRTPSFHVMLLSAMVAGLATWIFFTWLPLFFTENYGMRLGAAGLAGVALYKAPVIFGIVLGGWLSDRVARRDARGRAMIKALSFIVSSPFLFFFIGAPSFFLVAAMLVISSAIRALGVPSEHPIICDIVPPAFRSTAMGILNTCATAAGGLGVLLAGLFKKDFGLNVIFGVSSGFYFLAGVVMVASYYWFMPKDIERARKYEEASVPSPG
jgi:predicted MFS family arabinose efflux permease